MPQVSTLFIDGIFGRPRRFKPLRRLLEKEVGPTAVYHYNSTGLRTFEYLAKGLIELIRQTASTSGQPVNLIGFSMGGIVARTARLLAPDLPLHRAAFLHVPHRGTILAYALPFAGVRQLRPASKFLLQLNAADWPIPSLVTWSPCDFIILPGQSGNWHRAVQSIRCPIPLHPWPVWSRKIHRQIANFFSSTPEAPTILPAANDNPMHSRSHPVRLSASAC